MKGKNNIATGLIIMGFFMIYGFLLIYLRDFAPDKEQWIEQYAKGKHFEMRLAHVHGNLFAFLNIVIGFLLINFKDKITNTKIISWLAIGGILMPVGILAEIYLSAPPIFVLLGAISMIVSVFWLGVSFYKLKMKGYE